MKQLFVNSFLWKFDRSWLILKKKIHCIPFKELINMWWLESFLNSLISFHWKWCTQKTLLTVGEIHTSLIVYCLISHSFCNTSFTCSLCSSLYIKLIKVLSKKHMTKLSKNLQKISFIKCSKIVGTLVNLKGLVLYSKSPYSSWSVVFQSSLFFTCIRL